MKEERCWMKRTKEEVKRSRRRERIEVSLHLHLIVAKKPFELPNVEYRQQNSSQLVNDMC